MDGHICLTVSSVFTRVLKADANRDCTHLVRKAQQHVFIDKSGVRGSGDWQVSQEALEEYNGKDPGECAVLVQCSEHHAAVRQSFSHLPEVTSGNMDGLFGENVTVSGGDCSSICVGDEFTVLEEESAHKNYSSERAPPLRIQVSSPRRPCSRVDRRFKSKYGLKGVRHHCLMNTNAGFFCRVLTPGPLVVGAKLVLSKRPHPTWTLGRLGSLLYGASGESWQSWGSEWSGTRDELVEAAGLQELAHVDWREVLLPLLDREGVVNRKHDKKSLFETVVAGPLSALGENRGLQHFALVCLLAFVAWVVW